MPRVMMSYSSFFNLSLLPFLPFALFFVSNTQTQLHMIRRLVCKAFMWKRALNCKGSVKVYRFCRVPISHLAAQNPQILQKGSSPCALVAAVLNKGAPKSDLRLPLSQWPTKLRCPPSVRWTRTKKVTKTPNRHPRNTVG